MKVSFNEDEIDMHNEYTYYPEEYNREEYKAYNNYDDIIHMFLSTKPTSLLIRGLPGTGKTTLALELLAASRRPGYYISTRVSLKKIKEYFPWVADLLKDEYIAKSDYNCIDSSKDVPVTDARLGTSRAVVERVMDFILTHKNAVIILDSWDAIAKETSVDERLKAEKSMVYMADANDSMLIFISEEPEHNTLAYLVDSIVTLEMKYKDGFRLRHMKVDKMRGMQIDYSVIPYTLKGSRFIPLSSKDYSYPGVPMQFNAIENGNGFLSTGSKDMDAVLGGGVRKGSVVLIEKDQGINKSYVAHILASLTLNSLKNRLPVISTPAPYVPLKSVLKYVKPFCSREELSLYTVFTKDDSSDDAANVCKLTDDASFNVNQTCSIYMKNVNEYKSTILTCDTSVANVNYDLNEVINGMRKVKSSDGVLFMVSSKDSPLFNVLQSTADIHIRLWAEHGVTLCQFIRPYKGIHAMMLESEHKGYPYYRLVEVV
jgi:KaiC/GvpD/RAD55 family RecA-like ATPase